MNQIKDGTLAGTRKVGEGIGSGFQSVAGLATSPFRPGLPIVEARPNEWEKLPSGHERALAYQEKQRQRRFWLFGPPADFEEPELPEAGGDAGAFSLLPPKN
jgi:hypothetical protein